MKHLTKEFLFYRLLPPEENRRVAGAIYGSSLHQKKKDFLEI